MAGLAQLAKHQNINKNNALKSTKPKQSVDNSSAKPEDEAPKDEKSFFQQAMSDVVRLGDHKKRRPPKVKVPAIPQTPSEDEEALISLSELVSGQGEFDISDSDEHVEGRSEGLDPRIMKKLRKGAYSAETYLDLHGLLRAEAKIALQHFVGKSQRDGVRCVLIVHGRGLHSKDQQAVLKEAVVSWLGRSSLRKQVLAFCTARPYDGGAGALYVLLRKLRS